MQGKLSFTLPFNNMRTLKFKAQPTNGFFAAVNQMFGDSFQLSTTAEDCFVVSTLLNDLIISRSAVVGSWKELHLIDGSEKRICWLSFEF